MSEDPSKLIQEYQKLRRSGAHQPEMAEWILKDIYHLEAFESIQKRNGWSRWLYKMMVHNHNYFRDWADIKLARYNVNRFVDGLTGSEIEDLKGIGIFPSPFGDLLGCRRERGFTFNTLKAPKGWPSDTIVLQYTFRMVTWEEWFGLTHAVRGEVTRQRFDPGSLLVKTQFKPTPTGRVSNSVIPLEKGTGFTYDWLLIENAFDIKPKKKDFECLVTTVEPLPPVDIELSSSSNPLTSPRFRSGFGPNNTPFTSVSIGPQNVSIDDIEASDQNEERIKYISAAMKYPSTQAQWNDQYMCKPNLGKWDTRKQGNPD